MKVGRILSLQKPLRSNYTMAVTYLEDLEHQSVQSCLLHRTCEAYYEGWSDNSVTSPEYIHQEIGISTTAAPVWREMLWRLADRKSIGRSDVLLEAL